MTLEQYIKDKKATVITKLTDIVNLNDGQSGIIYERDEFYEVHGKIDAYNTVLTALALINEYGALKGEKK